MKFIAHRVNTVAELNNVPSHCGVEVDLRDDGQEIILAHDPFCGGENFTDFLGSYNHGLLILNVKSERIEFRILDLLKEHNLTNYFFLDSSFPMIHHLTLHGETRVAIRLSEFETIHTALAMAPRAGWVWVDCFSRLPIGPEEHRALKEAGFQLCLVSPELQGRPEDLPAFRRVVREQGLTFDAVCSKMHHFDFWMS